MKRSFEDYLVFDKSEVKMNFDVEVEKLPGFIPEGEVKFETYGPLFRDDFDEGLALQIDIVLEKQLQDNGRLERIVEEMLDEME